MIKTMEGKELQDILEDLDPIFKYYKDPTLETYYKDGAYWDMVFTCTEKSTNIRCRNIRRVSEKYFAATGSSEDILAYEAKRLFKETALQLRQVKTPQVNQDLMNVLKGKHEDKPEDNPIVSWKMEFSLKTLRENKLNKISNL